MDHELALMQVNDIKQQLALLVRYIVTVLADHKVSPLEGMLLGTRGLTFATTMVALLQGLPPEQLRSVLEVLEHYVFAPPPTLPLRQAPFPETPLSPGPGA
jgi:hypothetical protein